MTKTASIKRLGNSEVYQLTASRNGKGIISYHLSFLNARRALTNLGLAIASTRRGMRRQQAA